MHLTKVIKSPLFWLIPTGFVLVLLGAFPSIGYWLLADHTGLMDLIARFGLKFGLLLIGIAFVLDIAFLDEDND